jgi:hypothetical protein
LRRGGRRAHLPTRGLARRSHKLQTSCAGLTRAPNVMRGLDPRTHLSSQNSEPGDARKRFKGPEQEFVATIKNGCSGFFLRWPDHPA